MRVRYGDALSLMEDLLQQIGLDSRKAKATARAIGLAEAWGLASHGMLRLPIYLDRLEAGGCNPRAKLSEVKDLGALLVLDGEAGMGHWQMSEAVTMGIPRARQFGVCAVAVGNSSHCGALGSYVADAAEAGLVAVMFSSGPPVIPAWGGLQPLLSTSPIAAGFPLQPRPAVVDLALSAVARGKIAAHAARGEAIPEGWALDSAGQPTKNAAVALEGLLLPLGGAKGFALAYMVEMLTAGLVGPSLSKDMPDFFNASDATKSQNIAHLLILLDPSLTDAGGDPAAAEARIADLAAAVVGTGGRTPGSRRLSPSEVSPDLMIEVSEQLWGELLARSAYPADARKEES